MVLVWRLCFCDFGLALVIWCACVRVSVRARACVCAFACARAYVAWVAHARVLRARNVPYAHAPQPLPSPVYPRARDFNVHHIIACVM